jgi:hypothetical protein
MKVIYTKLEVCPRSQDDSINTDTYTFYGLNSEQKAITRAKEIHDRQPDKRIYIGVYSLYGND